MHLYIGHAAYKVGDKDPAWNNPDEIPNQIKYNTERFNQVKVSVFFSYKDLKKQPAWHPGPPNPGSLPLSCTYTCHALD
ncbi:hypothetical protein P7H20_21975 [Paenibacillus larvae]|nr:hypothetical protein [Paenibacillus larvae]MDT2276977.1 hypothetical protein [Paenibacillus larvae]